MPTYRGTKTTAAEVVHEKQAIVLVPRVDDHGELAIDCYAKVRETRSTRYPVTGDMLLDPKRLGSSTVTKEAPVRIGSFQFGCNNEVDAYTLSGAAYQPNLELQIPQGTRLEDMAWVEKGDQLIGPLKLYYDGFPRTALASSLPAPFSIREPHQETALKDKHPIIFEEARRTFLVAPEVVYVRAPRSPIRRLDDASLDDVPVSRRAVSQWKFSPFYHPYVCSFMKELNRDGLDGLYRPGLQDDPQRDAAFDFKALYQADSYVTVPPYPREDVDFAPDGAYALYNWELFFHAPLMIADRLRVNQRFDEAQRWYHFIFDPTNRDTSVPVPDRYWKLKPFRGVDKTSLQELLALLEGTSEDTEQRELMQSMSEQVDRWRDDPFKPDLIAQLRFTAYQRAVVMRYLDNLIAWGDQLFRRDTIESINEATLLYVMAAELLGARPREIPSPGNRASRTYLELQADEDEFLVSVEHLVSLPEDGAGAADAPDVLTSPYYFCVPKNQKLMGYWATVEDRLFKIRNCQNIDGVRRQLALFAPPIEPGLLVRAAAAGVDLGSVLSDVNAPMPHYRFRTMLAKALELCADVKLLGASLLSALEKRDSEAIALLRSGHEIRVLEAVQGVRKCQIDESKEALEGIKLSKTVTETRRNYYRDIVRINKNEQSYLDHLESSHKWQEKGQIADVIAQILPLIGDFDVGLSGWACSPVVKWRWGGLNLAQAAQATSRIMSYLSTKSENEGTRASIKGGYDRRWDDWKLQERLASKELEQLDKQIVAAEIRVELAKKELDNTELQVENAKSTDDFMRSKFTSRELYDWMVSQISAVYFQSYQMAYDIAKRAQRAYQYERGSNETFVEFGYWDSLKKGLLSGEKLHYDLKRMEMAYLEGNRRDYELTKHVSLAIVDPVALLRLKETGECFVDLPEELFDLDNPGHYGRRIKTLNISIPCVTGPYTGVNCTLTLLANTVRRSPTLPAGIVSYARARSNGAFQDDERFIDSIGAIQSIVTSTGRDDSGLFEQNMQDERYLPFEGAGAVSRWRIQLPKETNQFDFNSIGDVVISVRYTAREGGEELKQAALKHLREWVASAGHLYKVFSTRDQFPDAWHRFFTPASGGAAHVLELKDFRKRIPTILGETSLEIQSMMMLMGLEDGVVYDSGELNFDLSKDDTPVGGPHSLQLGLEPVPVLPSVQVISSAMPLDNATWRLTVSLDVVDALAAKGSGLVTSVSDGADTRNVLDRTKIQGMWFLIVYATKD